MLPHFSPQRKRKFRRTDRRSSTLLGMLRINYIQNNLGIDLLKEERPCMFFSADNMLGVKDTKHFYIYDTESKQDSIIIFITEL